MRTAARPIPPITAKVQAKLWANIEKRSDGIWAWKGPRCGRDARIHIGYEPFYVSRVMWVMRERARNPYYQIPDGIYVCHRNDVTPELYDCNPANLWLGTNLDNALDRERKRRGNHPMGKNNGTHTKPETLRRGDGHHARLRPECMARGENQGSAKLNWAQVHEIRALYATGGFRQKELAARFGVTWHNIKRIVNWKNWRSDRGNAYADGAEPAAGSGTVIEQVAQEVTVGSPSSG